MHSWHFLRRTVHRQVTAPVTALVIALLIAALLPAPHFAAAQDDDPAAEVEARALAAHLQNLRLNSFTAWIGGSLGDPSHAPRRSPLIEQFDDWTLAGFAGDDDLDLATLDRPVLLNFWASWCPPCRAEFPQLADVTAAPDDHAFDVAFVNTSDTEADALDFLVDYPPELTTVRDENDRFSLRAGIETIPTSLLLDTDGTVLVVHVGLVTATVTAFLDAVAAHPGAGIFIAAEHMVDPPGAALDPVSVQDATPIESGASVSSTIDDDQFQHAYRITGTAGEQLTATLRAGTDELDPYLVLMTADGERLQENDDITRGGNTDAQISVTLPADGTYLIVATRFLEAEGIGEGPANLTVTLAAPDSDSDSGSSSDSDSGADTATRTPVPQTSTPDARLNGVTSAHPVTLPAHPHTPARSSDPQPDEHTLSYGDSASGTISDRQYEQRWRFEGRAGDVVNIAMQRTIDEDGGLDGYLILEGPDGETLLEVDDSNDSVMPAIDDFELPVDGTYTIVATRFSFASGFSDGDYTLSLALEGALEPPDDTASAPASMPVTDVRWLRSGEPAHGAIDSADLHDWYAFRGREGDTITIRMARADDDTDRQLDPLLILTDLDGNELARNDDSRDGGDSPQDAAISFDVPTDATYLVQATRYGMANGPSSGAYTLWIETDSDAAQPTAADAIALDYGDTASGNLTLEQPFDQYRFAGQHGDMITLHVRGTVTLTPGIALHGPDGALIADDRAATTDGVDTLLRIVLPADGTYTAEIAPLNLTGTGDYTLLLLGHAPAAIDAGAFVPAPDLDLELVLIWSSAADLDLALGPDGSAAPVPPEITRANDFCQDVTTLPIERVTWATGDAVAGAYNATITYRHNCAATSEPVRFVLVIARQGEVLGITGGTLAREGDSYSTPVMLLE